MGFDCLPERWRGATDEPGDGREAGGSPASQRSARVGSRGGVAGLADGAEEFVAGAADGLGGSPLATSASYYRFRSGFCWTPTSVGMKCSRWIWCLPP